MNPKPYRKKPVVIEAMQWDGGNGADIVKFCSQAEHHLSFLDEGKLYIKTLEGTMEASLGDYIIRGIAGEFYPCKPAIFEATYEPIVRVE